MYINYLRNFELFATFNVDRTSFIDPTVSFNFDPYGYLKLDLSLISSLLSPQGAGNGVEVWDTSLLALRYTVRGFCKYDGVESWGDGLKAWGFSGFYVTLGDDQATPGILKPGSPIVVPFVAGYPLLASYYTISTKPFGYTVQCKSIDGRPLGDVQTIDDPGGVGVHIIAVPTSDFPTGTEFVELEIAVNTKNKK